MSDVVNGRGTAGRARLPIDGVLMAGKTGTAQVVGLTVGSGKGGIVEISRPRPVHLLRAVRQSALCRAVVIEHGGGSGAAYPIARDVMTFLFDRQKAMDVLLTARGRMGRHDRASAWHRDDARAANAPVATRRARAADPPPPPAR